MTRQAAHNPDVSGDGSVLILLFEPRLSEIRRTGYPFDGLMIFKKRPNI
jgi:hypothetical protein